jgi:ribosomal protein S18 acetylase RimI-like enzyme
MVHIRAIRKEDASELRKVLDAVARERRYLGRLEAPPEDKFCAFVESIVESGHTQHVAEEDGRIVGWCDVLPGTVSAGTAHIGHLGMGVLKNFRGGGIGRRLAEATIKKARALGLEKIELSVYSSNDAAIALYRNLGFREEGRKVRGRLVDGIYDDVLLLALDLMKPNQSPDPELASGTSRARHESRHR